MATDNQRSVIKARPHNSQLINKTAQFTMAVETKCVFFFYRFFPSQLSSH